MDERSDLLLGSARRPKPCASMQKACFGLGHVYNDLCAAVWFSYTLFYFQIILQMDSMTAGTLIMIGQVADSMATPAAGWAVDWICAPRAWHLTGTGLVAVGFSLIFSVSPDDGHWWSLVWYGALVVLFQIGWAIVQISHLSVITTVAEDDDHSANLTAIRYTASVCCNIFVYVITWAILKSMGSMESIGPGDFYKFKEIALIITGIGLVASSLFYCSNTERGQREKPSEKGSSSSSFLRSPVTYQVSLMYMSSRLYTTLNLIYIPLYLDERISKSDRAGSIRDVVATVPLISFLASFINSLFLRRRSEFFSDKMIYSLGAVVSLIGCLCVAIGVPETQTAYVYVIACLIGIGGSATMVTSLCLTAKFVTVNGFKGGSVYSTVTFTDKLVSGVVVLIIQNLQCSNREQCPNFYEQVLAYATGLSAAVGLLSLLTLQCQNPSLSHEKL